MIGPVRNKLSHYRLSLLRHLFYSNNFAEWLSRVVLSGTLGSCTPQGEEFSHRFAGDLSSLKPSSMITLRLNRRLTSGSEHLWDRGWILKHITNTELAILPSSVFPKTEIKGTPDGFNLGSHLEHDVSNSPAASLNIMRMRLRLSLLPRISGPVKVFSQRLRRVSKCLVISSKLSYSRAAPSQRYEVSSWEMELHSVKRLHVSTARQKEWYDLPRWSFRTTSRRCGFGDWTSRAPRTVDLSHPTCSFIGAPDRSEERIFEADSNPLFVPSCTF
jgi:hypothetical protein